MVRVFEQCRGWGNNAPKIKRHAKTHLFLKPHGSKLAITATDQAEPKLADSPAVARHRDSLVVVVHQTIRPRRLYLDRHAIAYRHGSDAVAITEIRNHAHTALTLFNHGQLTFEAQGYAVA